MKPVVAGSSGDQPFGPDAGDVVSPSNCVSMWSYSRYVRRRITSVLALSAIAGPSVKTENPAVPAPEPTGPEPALPVPPEPALAPAGAGVVEAPPSALAPLPLPLQPASTSAQPLRTKLEV